VEEHLRCTATSSGLLSRNRFRVLLPMSLPSTRVTGSPQLLFPKSKLNLPVGPDVDADMLSRSMAIPWSGKGVGESESGVETKPPKLEREMGESSDERLRLKPIVDAVRARCNAKWGCGWVASDLVEADDEMRRRDAIWNATASDVLGLGSGMKPALQSAVPKTNSTNIGWNILLCFQPLLMLRDWNLILEL
jgi:hypothetical protein